MFPMAVCELCGKDFDKWNLGFVERKVACPTCRNEKAGVYAWDKANPHIAKLVGLSGTQTVDFSGVVDEIAKVVKKKNAAYGDSFGTSGAALKILYPNGIQPEQYGNALLLARIWDKLKRVATDNDPDGESPFVDIAGYAVLGVNLNKRGK
jgi:hypothetical protein